MLQFLLSVLFVVSMWFGNPAPATASIAVDNNDDAVNVYEVITDIDGLSNYGIEDGSHIGVLELQCSEHGNSPTDSFNVTTSGGGYATEINVADCTDLLSEGGASYQSIEMPGFGLELSCNSDCDVYYLYAQFEDQGLKQEVGKIWIVPTGPNPQLVVTGK